MALKERDQNPVIGSTIRLRLFTFNGNNPQNVSSIEKIDIYFLDPSSISTTNTDGRVFVETVPSSSVIEDSEGQYHIDLVVNSPTFVIGDYLDIWSISYQSGDAFIPVENNFSIYSNNWYSSTQPIVYDFGFDFQPNAIALGSKLPLRIQIKPVVPTGTILDEYYADLAIVSSLKVSIQKKCNVCTDDEELVVDQEDTQYSDKVFAYYTIDTTEDSDYDFDEGVYDIWFTLEFGGNVYVSTKQQLLIYN